MFRRTREVVLPRHVSRTSATSTGLSMESGTLPRPNIAPQYSGEGLTTAMHVVHATRSLEDGKQVLTLGPGGPDSGSPSPYMKWIHVETPNLQDGFSQWIASATDPQLDTYNLDPTIQHALKKLQQSVERVIDDRVAEALHHQPWDLSLSVTYPEHIAGMTSEPLKARIRCTAVPLLSPQDESEAALEKPASQITTRPTLPNIQRYYAQVWFLSIRQAVPNHVLGPRKLAPGQADMLVSFSCGPRSRLMGTISEQSSHGAATVSTVLLESSSAGRYFVPVEECNTWFKLLGVVKFFQESDWEPRYSHQHTDDWEFRDDNDQEITEANLRQVLGTQALIIKICLICKACLDESEENRNRRRDYDSDQGPSERYFSDVRHSTRLQKPQITSKMYTGPQADITQAMGTMAMRRDRMYDYRTLDLDLCYAATTIDVDLLSPHRKTRDSIHTLYSKRSLEADATDTLRDLHFDWTYDNNSEVPSSHSQENGSESRVLISTSTDSRSEASMNIPVYPHWECEEEPTAVQVPPLFEWALSERELNTQIDPTRRSNPVHEIIREAELHLLAMKESFKAHHEQLYTPHDDFFYNYESDYEWVDSFGNMKCPESLPKFGSRRTTTPEITESQLKLARQMHWVLAFYIPENPRCRIPSFYATLLEEIFQTKEINVQIYSEILNSLTRMLDHIASLLHIIKRGVCSATGEAWKFGTYDISRSFVEALWTLAKMLMIAYANMRLISAADPPETRIKRVEDVGQSCLRSLYRGRKSLIDQTKANLHHRKLTFEALKPDDLLMTITTSLIAEDSKVSLNVTSGILESESDGYDHIKSNSVRKKRLESLHRYSRWLWAISTVLHHQSQLVGQMLQREDYYDTYIQNQLTGSKKEVQRRIGQVEWCQTIVEDGSTKLSQSIESWKQDNESAILVFTVVTVIFLPLSFMTSYFGMNTTDIRDMGSGQGIFWAAAIPTTVLTMCAAFIGGYGWRKSIERAKWVLAPGHEDS